VDPTLPLIVETDASKKAIGAALIQEVKTEEVIERRLIYTTSRSLKSAETKYSIIWDFTPLVLRRIFRFSI